MKKKNLKNEIKIAKNEINIGAMTYERYKPL